MKLNLQVYILSFYKWWVKFKRLRGMLSRLRESEQGLWQTALCVTDKIMQSEGAWSLTKKKKCYTASKDILS